MSDQTHDLAAALANRGADRRRMFKLAATAGALGAGGAVIEASPAAAVDQTNPAFNVSAFTTPSVMLKDNAAQSGPFQGFSYPNECGDPDGPALFVKNRNPGPALWATSTNGKAIRAVGGNGKLALDATSSGNVIWAECTGAWTAVVGWSAGGFGVHGLTSSGSNPAIRAESLGSSPSLHATSGGDQAIRAESQANTTAAIVGTGLGSSAWGIYGKSNGTHPISAGVAGEGQTGVRATGTAIDLHAAGTGMIRRDPYPSPLPPATGVFVEGDLLTRAGESWVCVESGDPGSWRLLAGPRSAGSLHLMTPNVMLYDSETAVPANSPQTVYVPTRTVPAGAVGVLVSVLLASSPAVAGAVRLYPAGSTTPPPNLTFAAGQRGSTSVTVSLPALTRRLKVSTTGAVRLQLVIQGYYR